jgi:hypothetical protein
MAGPHCWLLLGPNAAERAIRAAGDTFRQRIVKVVLHNTSRQNR